MPAYAFGPITTSGTGGNIQYTGPWMGTTRRTFLPLPTYQVVGTHVIEAAEAPADSTPPITVYVTATATKVSAVTGFNETTITWSVDEDCQAWQIREVADAGDSIATAGQLVASGGAVAANTSQQATIAASSLSVGDATKLLKIFAQDLAGNWST